MKTVLLYILMVGFLFVCLLGILHVGETIAAPPDVSGIWKIDNVNGTLNHRCLPEGVFNSNIIIEQSGVYLSVHLNDEHGTRIQGKISNNKIIFSGDLPAQDNEGECVKEIKMKLNMQLHRQGQDSIRLTGKWSLPDCSRCGQIQFSAVKTSGKDL